jgi:hypothetical protein
VARSDYLLASAVRQSASQAARDFSHPGHTLWFQGHWGFQYYLTDLGGQVVDGQQSAPQPGDVLAVPLNNTSVQLPPGPRQGYYAEGPRFLAVMNKYSGAGFYSALGGPLPFVIDPIPPEYVMIYTLHAGR